MTGILKQFFQKSEKRIHLDYASTTPVHPDILNAMEPYWNQLWANPSAIYREGVAARKVIDDARTELARVLHVRPTDITFTSGGTESNNLALIGYIEALHNKGMEYEDMEIISTKIEHASILETLTYLEKRGVKIVCAPVTEEGSILPQEFRNLLSGKTVLVSFAYANSEVGTVQDVKKLTRIVRLHNEERNVETLIHLDASQAPLWLPCVLDQLGIDLMTLDAGKCYGPKGVGVLVRRHWVHLAPLMHGGGQETGLRSGTENPALVVGCVRALVRAQQSFEARSNSVTVLRNDFIALLKTEIEGVIVNGSNENRIANNVHISIPGLDTEYAVIWLDTKGVAASTKSACGALETTGSQVVREMTHDNARALSTLRFTLGEESAHSDIKTAVQVLKDFIHRTT